jgi:FkbM family methyltransferase
MNRLWGTVERVGLAPVLRSGYLSLQNAWRGGRYRAQVGDVSVTFRTSTWYEFKRARALHGERHVVEAFLDDIEGDETVWDVGANVGMYACFAAKVLTSGTVVGFEPVPQNRARLVENLETNAPASRWETSPYPLSRVDAPARMAFGHDPKRRTDPGAGHHYLTDEGGWLSVECRRGETLVAEGLAPPDVMKIDVQGAELDVLEGMGRVLDDVQSIYLEIHRTKSGRYGTSADEIEAFLRSSGFELEQFGDPDTYRHGVYHVLAHRGRSGVGSASPS